MYAPSPTLGCCSVRVASCSASIALGNVAAGNLQHYLPTLLKHIHSSAHATRTLTRNPTRTLTPTLALTLAVTLALTLTRLL